MSRHGIIKMLIYCRSLSAIYKTVFPNRPGAILFSHHHRIPHFINNSTASGQYAATTPAANRSRLAAANQKKKKKNLSASLRLNERQQHTAPAKFNCRELSTRHATFFQSSHSPLIVSSLSLQHIDERRARGKIRTPTCDIYLHDTHVCIEPRIRICAVAAASRSFAFLMPLYTTACARELWVSR